MPVEARAATDPDERHDVQRFLQPQSAGAEGHRARFLITGGAGFLGINLTRYLLARGQQVTSLDLAPFAYPERERITVCTGDIRNREDLHAALVGVDIVIHCAAALPLYAREDIYTTDIDGTRRVMEEARRAGCSRAVHISSTAVYGIPDHHPLYEDDPLVGIGPYGEAKIEAEHIARAARADDFIVPILRPKTFIGEERLGVFALLYEWAADGHGFPILGSGRNRYQYLAVEDLCDAIWLCCTLSRERAEATFNIGAREFGTVREDFQALLDHAGYDKRVRSLPIQPAIWALRALDRLKLSPLYPWVYETVARDSYVSIARAEERLGFAPRHSNQAALIRNYDWYVANRATFEGAAGISHRQPWKQGALALAKRFF
ncbi:MAG: NAD-dependent epimerase/dehydratase family protein [Chloroflexi bacterium]|nr:NAD-dependent epimerase/dehydratase family protein [Anaerolineaceae bacterium]MCY4106150.1 NAD-dependent epimerase/dehydratase family protein [Chloroflexota bacterium]